MSIITQLPPGSYVVDDDSYPVYVWHAASASWWPAELVQVWSGSAWT